MLTIEQLRDTLPDKGKNLTNEQMTKLRDDLYTLANICFDMWLKERNEKKEITEKS